ncbi:MAG: hypothetical protein K0S33_2420 [Bacteroidetes bacterium]|jgi:hypothetical protein|nr:hypothetical protein [Bacteroidota bacterium]
MDMRPTIRIFLIVLLLSVSALVLWLLEITQIKGWHGLNWLNGVLLSPYIIACIPVFSFLTPFLIRKQTLSIKKTILAAVLLYGSSILCFEIGKQISYLIYCRFCFFNPWILLLIAFFTFLLCGFLYWLITNMLLQKTKWYKLFIIGLTAILVIPVSLASIHFFPGLGTQDGWVDAVKMGHPVFWITILFGASGFILSRQKIKA